MLINSPTLVHGSTQATAYQIITQGGYTGATTGAAGGSFYVESTGAQNNFFSLTWGGKFIATPTSITFSNISKSHSALTISATVRSYGGMVYNIIANGASAGQHYLFADILAM